MGDIYRPQSKGDSALGSVCLSVHPSGRPFVCALTLSIKYGIDMGWTLSMIQSEETKLPVASDSIMLC